MKKMRILVLMHESLVPPDSTEGYTEEEILDWKTEFDVVSTLREICLLYTSPSPRDS